MLSQLHVCTNGSVPILAVTGGPPYVTCAKAPTFCVIAPPQKKLNGATVILLLSLYGAVFDPMSVDSGASRIGQSKGRHRGDRRHPDLGAILGGGGGLDRLFASSGGIYLPSL